MDSQIVIDRPEQDQGGGFSRRALLGGALAAAAVSLPKAVSAQSKDTDPSTRWKKANHRLARRIFYGLNSDDYALINPMSFQQLLDWQLNYTAISNTAVESQVTLYYPYYRKPMSELHMLDFGTTKNHLRGAITHYATNSKHQLYERMCEFWRDHFNVQAEKAMAWLTIPYDRDVIRPHAMGYFPDMLRAMCHHTAMLIYLDNNTNIGDKGNVNFARELLELHTMGVDGGYTGEDIVNVARAMSGWTWNYAPGTPPHGEFVFRSDRHSTLSKKFLGVTLSPIGKEEGDKVISMLAQHPSTARYLAKKMTRFFLGEDAPQSVMDATAAKYMETGGHIPSMLRVILTEQNVMASKAMFKRPHHLFCGALRSCRGELKTNQWVLQTEHFHAAGMRAYNWEQPDGYPMATAYWIKSYLPRVNFILELLNGKIDAVRVYPTSLLGAARLAPEIEQRIDDIFTHGEMSPNDRDHLRTHLTAGTIDNTRLMSAFALALASPSYQWY